jgi:hypothetical protein
MRPRGSRKVTLELSETALNDRNASAKVSALVFPKPGSRAVCVSFFVPGAVAVAGLNNPVHNFGVAQAFGAGEAAAVSSVPGSAEGALSSPSCLTSGAEICCDFESSGTFSDTDFAVSLETDLGMAGITGTAGRVDRCAGLGATGVVSPGAASDEG